MPLLGRSFMALALAFASMACGTVQSAFAADRTFTGQLNRTVAVPEKVERIVTLQQQTLDTLVVDFR